MVFKKKSRSRRKKSFNPFKKSRRSKSSNAGSSKLLHVDAMIYGGLRGVVANKVTPMLNGVMPQTAQYNDNICMAGISYLAAKYGSGMIKSVGQKGLIVENALIAADLANNIIPATISGAKKAQTGYIYG